MDKLNNIFINFKYYYREYKLLLYKINYDSNNLSIEMNNLLDQIIDLEQELNKNNIIIIDKYYKINSIYYLSIIKNLILFLY